MQYIYCLKTSIILDFAETAGSVTIGISLVNLEKLMIHLIRLIRVLESKVVIYLEPNYQKSLCLFNTGIILINVITIQGSFRILIIQLLVTFLVTNYLLTPTVKGDTYLKCTVLFYVTMGNQSMN